MVKTWKECIRSLSGMAVWSVLMFKTKETKEVKVTILEQPWSKEYVDVQAGIPTNSYNKQDYFFYSKVSEDVTEIAIYEESMSKRNAGKCIRIIENTPFKSIDRSSIEAYKNSIVEFILANIVWKEEIF